jgi:hypothetical protein
VRRRPAAEVLERRYRRLLAWYPAGYRAANGDEILGVALARSAEGQHWPDPGEAASLMLSGIRRRLGAGWQNPVRRDTAAVLTVAGPLLLAAINGQFLNERPWQALFLMGTGMPLPLVVCAIAAIAWWTLVAVAAMLRWPRVVAAGAWLGTAGQAPLAWSVLTAGFMISCLLLLIALIVAVAALGSVRAQGRPLSWRAAAAVAAGAAMIPGWPAIQAATVTVSQGPVFPSGVVETLSSPLSGGLSWFNDAALACTVLVLTVAIGWLRPAVRRRVAILLVPAIVAATAVCWLDGVFLLFHQMLYLDLINLVLVPAASAGAGLAGVALCQRVARRTAGDGPAGPPDQARAGPAG